MKSAQLDEVEKALEKHRTDLQRSNQELKNYETVLQRSNKEVEQLSWCNSFRQKCN
jgi:hypothetical protein